MTSVEGSDGARRAREAQLEQERAQRQAEAENARQQREAQLQAEREAAQAAAARRDSTVA